MNDIAAESSSTGKVKTLQILNIIGFVIMVFMNFLANWLPINGKTTGELSEQYPNLFVPAGITFSIWGVIYLLLLIFTLYQASTLFRSKISTVNTLVRNIRPWYFTSSLLNSLWIIAWHYEFTLVSVSIILLLLFSLIMINIHLRNSVLYLPARERLIAKLPFGIYLGWISVATIANVTAWLTDIQWSSGLEEDTWAVLMIIIGMIISLFAAFRLQNGYLLLAVAWAFAGIIIKRVKQDEVYFSIAFVAGAAAVILLVSSMIVLIRESSGRSRRVDPSTSSEYR